MEIEIKKQQLIEIWIKFGWQKWAWVIWIWVLILMKNICQLFKGMLSYLLKSNFIGLNYNSIQHQHFYNDKQIILGFLLLIREFLHKMSLTKKHTILGYSIVLCLFVVKCFSEKSCYSVVHSMILTVYVLSLFHHFLIMVYVPQGMEKNWKRSFIQAAI